MVTKDKKTWILIIFILSGIVIGGLLGELASKIDWLWWLGYGQSFGMSEPLALDLNILKISFSIMFKINVASILGIAASLLIYRKV